LKIDVSEAGFLLSAGAPRLGSRRKMAEEDISTFPNTCGIRDLCKELTFDDNAGRNGDKQGPPAGE
jgi:hypothetical protein